MWWLFTCRCRLITWPTFVQAMVHHLFGVKPLVELMLTLFFPGLSVIKNMQAGMHTPLILNICQECMEFCSTLRGTRISTKPRLYLGYELWLDHYKLVIRSWVISLSLQNFYKNEIDRQEMYIRYIYKLRDLHRACESYTEAGFTLLLHAELLPWGNAMLPADLGYPAQMQWQRKEELYLKIINYFDRGKVGTGNRKKMIGRQILRFKFKFVVSVHWRWIPITALPAWHILQMDIPLKQAITIS